ncbi:MAG: hypothetical protein ACE15B_16860 [Bryobacteraceae bacterium]
MEFDLSRTGPFWAALRLARLSPGESFPKKPLRCPACWAIDCVPGALLTKLDHFRARRGGLPYECRVCGKRFRYYA